MDPIIESIEETIRLIGGTLERATPHTVEHNALTVLAKQADRLWTRADRLRQHGIDERIDAQQNAVQDRRLRL